MPINGQAYDWESLTVLLPSGLAVDIKSVGWQDSDGSEAAYGKGSNPIGWKKGQYKGSGKLSLGLLDAFFLETLLVPQGGLYGALINVQLAFANADKPPQLLMLNACKINSRTFREMTSEGGEAVKELEFIILKPVLNNGIPANLGRIL